MHGLRRLASPIALGQVVVRCAALSVSCLLLINVALAQEASSPSSPPTEVQPIVAPATAPPAPTVAQIPFSSQTRQTTTTTAGTPFEPPTGPPPALLPPAAGTLSLGQWLLTPTLGLYTLYDSNLYSSSTPVRGAGLHFHPALTAEYNTGIYDTQVYGNIDSIVYPTLDYHNNTFNRQAGIIQKYSPLPDLVFTAQADYTHNTQANVLTTSLPGPISAAGSPVPSGTAGVAAGQQTVVNPNDVYTAQATIYKEFNRAFVNLNGSLASTQFEQQSSQNYNRSTYDGIGGFWLTPQLYAFGDGIQSFTNPEVGPAANSFRARGGIGSGRIGLFQGFLYYGQQGSEFNGDGKAGGDIYGGAISYFPTDAWNMSFEVDRLRNISDITSNTTTGTPQALGGLPYLPAAVSPTQSLQITAFTFKSNYALSPLTSAYLVASYSIGDQISGPPLENQTWFVDIGLQHQIRTDLALTLDYQYSSFASATPQTSFIRNLVSAGMQYRF